MEHFFDQNTGTLTIRMPVELDHHTADPLRQDTEFLFSRFPVRSLVFDFRDTVFMDSSGIGVILGRCKSLNFACGQARAVNLNGQIQKIFKLSGLHKIMDVEN